MSDRASSHGAAVAPIIPAAAVYDDSHDGVRGRGLELSLEAVGQVVGGNAATAIERATCRNKNQIAVRGSTTGDVTIR